jgi:hypothetical protein
MYPQGTRLLINDCVEHQQLNCKYKCHVLLNMTMTNDRPIVSSERAPHFNKTATV